MEWIMSNNTEKIDDIEMTRYKALDRRFDLFLQLQLTLK